ncbi:peptidylprolyl isomerase [Crenobacter cavernae]|uniref:peptidylprolyl isomerase n=1 Tax=Crenobacter cavernae TaxID=2290923 RepID=A0A345Y7T8_9NEIS|nr:peptidylprolyl isomerase [Crenobacter cavernae]AXK39990.1 peptidylprolyl isomerase [Crenobacter cavernae]
MRKTLVISALAVAFAGQLVVAAPAAPVSQSRVDAVIRTLEAQGQQVTPQTRDMVREQLATADLLSQAAVKKGLDKTPEFRAELENMQAMSLANRLIRDYQKSNPVTETELKAAYAKLKAEMPEKKSYHARHILVKTEAEANAVIDALRKGKPFDALAKEKSLDPGSKANGGDLGWADAENFVPPFAEALTRLSKGQVTSKPVKTEFGWHVIKLDDVKTESAPPLDAIRQQLEQRVMSAKVDKFIEGIKAQAK